MTSPNENDTGTAPGLAMELNGHVLEPGSQMPGGHLFQETASNTNYAIIQFAKLPTVDQERELEELQVQFCQLIPPTSWLVKFEQQDLSPIRQLPFVVYANPYHESLSLNPIWLAQLQEKTQRPRLAMAAHGTVSSLPASKPERQNVIVMLHARSMSPSQMRDRLISTCGIGPERIFIDIMSLRASLSPEEIIRISRIDEVRGVYPEQESRLHNHRMRGIIHVEAARLVQNRNLRMGEDSELDGEEENIAIADSGLDKGSMTDVHPFFDASRILHMEARSEDQVTDPTGKTLSRKDVVEDWDAHGTHLAGTALGSYHGLKKQTDIEVYSPGLYGVAPMARLVVQAITGCPRWDAHGNVKHGSVKLTQGAFAFPRVFLDPYYGYPRSYTDTSATGSGPSPTPSAERRFPWRARIHSDSYGPQPDPTAYGYMPDGFELDTVLYKARELLAVFAAGNDGDDRDVLSHFRDGQITAYATAKNALVVGACFNEQWVNDKDPSVPGAPRLCTTYLSPGAGGRMLEANCMPRLGSRGPTASLNRAAARHANIIKPDVVAPGITIYSAKSRAQAKCFEGRDAGAAPNPDENCRFLSGTSMAAPCVAGAAALLRQALKRRGRKNPSAALLKALLVNGAVDMSREKLNGKQQGGRLWKGTNCDTDERLGPAPDDAQGWGRIDIADSVDTATNTRTCGFRDVTYDVTATPRPARDGRLKPDLVPKDEHRVAVQITTPPGILDHPDRVANLKATLAWTDLPGEGLQNQLSLGIEFIDENWRDQDIAVDVAGTGTFADLSRMAQNNVQKLQVRNIEIAPGQVAVVRIIVRAERIVADPGTGKKEPQDYALCWKVWYTNGDGTVVICE